ncbi:MAG: DUF3443 family protein, partial [Thiomonas sp.]
CGGGGGGSAPSDPPATRNPPVSLANPPSGRNVVPVSILQLASTGSNTANTPYVTVTVCNSSGGCVSIPDVLVDTGSAGLRLFASSALNSLNLPAVTTGTGGELAACAQFASGYTWGSMRSAMVQIGGLSTGWAIPIEVIGDTSIPQTAPQACQNQGQDFSKSLRSVVNGILGISNFQYDCGVACTYPPSAYATQNTPSPGVYYDCNGGTCTETSASYAQQGINPIAAFPASYNNGSILTLPAASLPWGSQAATGVLIFGINTASNNQLPAGAQVFALDRYGNLPIAVNGSSGTGFIDSGSNGYYTALNLPACTQSSGFYCPSPAANVALQLSSGAASSSTSITIANADTMFQTGNAALPALGGTAAITGQVDLGLPFFYGRTIGTGIQQAPNSNDYGFVAF